MPEQITTILSSLDFLASLSNNIDILAAGFNRYLSGANNLRMASIILMLLAFILFLFLIIIIYVKSIISFLKSDNSASNYEKKALKSNLGNEYELEMEMEKELEKELEQAHSEKENNEIIQQAEMRKTQAELEEKDVAQKKEEIRDKHEIAMDWTKNKIAEISTNVDTKVMNMQYHQNHKNLNELIGLIIDMIGRGVDELKIAQTAMFRNQGESSEDQIMQVIESIKEFIDLCINKAFEKLDNYSNLPKEDVALFHLANGDPSVSLNLLENLMDRNIEKVSSITNSIQKEKMFLEVSNQACVFGTLASLSDVNLALSAFELSIELNPSNINAWSRVADMYAKIEAHNKAKWAYKNMLDMAEDDIYPQQVANANKIMSQYLYEEGNSLQAAKLYVSSKSFYDSIGINRHLDKKELEIIEIIEANQAKDMENVIAKILNQKTL